MLHVLTFAGAVVITTVTMKKARPLSKIKHIP